MPVKKIHVGDTFGRWTVTGRTDGKWVLLCSCGNAGAVIGTVLLSGRSKSCGCLRREIGALRGKASRKHGMERSPEYAVWAQMKTRCSNPRDSRFKDYGGRGIAVCDRWQSFENFFADMGPRPSRHHSIDRMDNDGNYEPSNCRWTDWVTQNNNTRRNRYLKCSKTGRTQSVADWTRELGVSRNTVYRWCVGDTLYIRTKHSRRPR